MSTYGLQGNITLKNDNWVTKLGHPASHNSWYFEWSVYKESGSWKLEVKVEARNSSKTSYAYGGYEIVLNTGKNVGKRDYGKGLVWDLPDSTNANKYSTTHFYTFTETPPGKIELSFTGLNSYKDQYIAQQDITINLYEYRDAPTITTTERSYISGAEDFTIEWDNSNDDINTFSNYSVIVKIGNTQIHSDTQSGSSYTVTADKLSTSRGKTLTIQISSNGDHDDEATGSRKYANYETKINRLPSLEFVTENTIIASKNSNQEVTIKVKGTESDSGQSIKYYYSTTINGTKIPFNVNNVNDDEISGYAKYLQNYYFYAYDGYEYSESYKSNIIVNTVPTFKVSYTYAQEDSINLKEGDIYVTYLKITTSPQGGQQTNNSYKYSIFYGKDKSALNESEDFTTSSPEKIISNIRDYVPNERYYQISITRNDGIEEHTQIIDSIFYVTKNPKISFEIQEAKSHTLNGEVYYHFDDKLIIQIDYDTGYSGFEFELLPNNSFALINQQTPIPFTQCEIFEQGGLNKNKKYQYTLNFQRQNTGGYITGSISAWLDNDEKNKEMKNIAQISQIALSNLEGALTYKPYTATSWSLNFGVPSGFGSSENKSIYGFYSNDPKPNLILSYNGNEATITELTLGESSSDSTLQFSIAGKTLYDKLEVLELDKNGSTDISAYIQYTNDFNQTSVSDSLNVSINYQEDIELISGDIKSESISLKDWIYLKEGVCFDTIYLDFKTYNNLSEIRIYYMYGSTIREIYGFKLIDEITEKVGYGTPYPVTLEQSSDYRIPQITQDIKGEFFVDFVRVDGSISTTSLIKKQFYRHIEPSTSFASVNYDATEKKLTMEFLTSDFGAPDGLINNYQWSIKEQDSDQMTPINGSEVEYTISKDFVYLAPCLTTEFCAKYKNTNGEIVEASKTKTTKPQTSFVYSIVYNLLPTVSYRQNHLGINTLAPSRYSNSAIYIGTYGERDTIYFIGNDDSIKTLNVATGATSGFIVDGGSWDDIPGHIVPSTGGGDAPVGLANIAYTGEISDLQQKRNDIIIISGGSAPV